MASQETICINNQFVVQKSILEKSHFYQDLIKETNSDPNELDIPNLMSGFTPDFNVLTKYIRDGLDVIDTTPTEIDNLLTLCIRLDMPQIIASIMSDLKGEISNEKYKKYLINHDVFSACLTYHEYPLRFIYKTNALFQVDIRRFLISNMSNIVNAILKNLDPKFVLIEMSARSFYQFWIIQRSEFNFIPVVNNESNRKLYLSNAKYLDLRYAGHTQELCKFMIDFFGGYIAVKELGLSRTSRKLNFNQEDLMGATHLLIPSSIYPSNYSLVNSNL